MQNRKFSARNITLTGMLAALAFALMFLDFAIPIMPSFIKFDISDLPELVGTFALGPVYGVAICLIKNLLHMPLSKTGFIGEMSNFILGAAMSLTAGIIYHRHHNKKGAIIGAFAGAIVMGLISVVTNYFIVYPLYYRILNFPEAAILGMYQAINPNAKSIFDCLIIFNLPFTIAKGAVCAIITVLIYKPLSPILHGKRH